MLALVLLMLPISDSIPLTRSRLQLWGRLRARHHRAPDADRDRAYAQLRLYLPPTGRVGLVQAAPTGTTAREREYFFLQYALAPRLLVPGADQEFVVVCPASAAASRLDLSAFAAVGRFGDDFALYRRIRG